MNTNQNMVSASGSILLFIVMLNTLLLQHAYVHHPHWYRLTWITLPLLILSALFHRRQGMQTRRNYN